MSWISTLKDEITEMVKAYKSFPISEIEKKSALDFKGLKRDMNKAKYIITFKY